MILENASKLPLAGGKNADPDSLDSRISTIRKKASAQTGVFCRSLGEAVTMIQLLPYHNLGVMKYQRIDDSKIVLEAEPPSEEKIQSLKAVLESMGLPVTVH